MDTQPGSALATHILPGDRMAATRRDVEARLVDPYLTDHDRWVLRQFVCFLGGRAPEPDPRVVPTRDRRPDRVGRPAAPGQPVLCSRVRRANL